MHTEAIEAEGHLIGSHLLEAVFDKVIEHGPGSRSSSLRSGRPTSNSPTW